jgi:hypothetical protein
LRENRRQLPLSFRRAPRSEPGGAFVIEQQEPGPAASATIMRLRNRFVSDRIFEGGLASPQALPKELAEELYEVGARLGHYSAHKFLSHARLAANRDECVDASEALIRDLRK